MSDTPIEGPDTPGGETMRLVSFDTSRVVKVPPSKGPWLEGDLGSTSGAVPGIWMEWVGVLVTLKPYSFP